MITYNMRIVRTANEQYHVKNEETGDFVTVESLDAALEKVRHDFEAEIPTGEA